MLEHLQVIVVNETFQHLSLISSLFIITWGYCLTIKGWVSDDIQGIAAFSDRFLQQKDAVGNVIKEEKLDSYEVDYQNKKIRIKNCGWNPAIEFPGCFLRWFRLNWGKRFGKIGENSKGHTIYGWTQSAPKHHALNLIVQLANLFLGYNLLSHLFGMKIAFLSMLMFAVHPCGVQTVAWISGINYLFSLFGSLLTFNAVFYIHNPYILFPVITFTSLISCLTLLPGSLNWIILLILGHGNPAIIAGLVGLFTILRQGREVVTFRTKAFKDQMMGKSTGVYWRKLIIMVKTFWYYCRLIPFPKRLGLFHTWGYHFDEPIEHIDKEFWIGLLAIIVYGFGIYYLPWPVKFGMIWMLIYLLVFSNIITAQQFVSERYAFISTFGFSIILAYYFQNYPIVIAFLIGIAVMRIWIHLPTFQNEVRFYESNWFNFPESEVAMGNLGVAYLNHGLANKALDTWQEASRQNKFYDVPWYNLYSLCKQNGDVLGAKKFLRMCLDAKTVHFPDQWKKEMQELEFLSHNVVSIQEITQRVNKSFKEGNYECAGSV